VAASAPYSVGLIRLPVFSASWAKSALMKCRAAARPPSSSLSELTRPSPMAVRSVIEYTRCVEATKVVRLAVTRPRCSARPASISSEAITMSTSPGTGLRAMTGMRPAGTAASGNISR